MPYTADAWQIGNVTVTRIVENENGGFPPGLMFHDLTEQRVREIAWLQPHYADSTGALRLSFHAFVIESAGKRIIVDTCVGNDKERAAEHFNRLNTAFLERLAAAGFPPESIDYVLCTHMHIDHVGWNTRWDGAQWVPTFPAARYLFARLEWEHFQKEAASSGDVPAEMAAMLQCEAVIADSVRPVIDRGLATFVESDHQITSEVSLLPTPGHTPGHVSVAISSAGQRAVITGDVIHHPVQILDPSISATVDHDRRRAEATRRALITECVDQDVLVLGTHFPAPSGGKIIPGETAKSLEFSPAAQSARNVHAAYSVKV